MVLHRYAYWPYGVFKKLGIPGPKPVPFFGTMLAYRKVGEYNFFGNKKGLTIEQEIGVFSIGHILE